MWNFWLIGKQPRYNIDVHFDFKYVPQERFQISEEAGRKQNESIWNR